ncbi:hypothetical protein ACS8Y6_17740 [Salinisphaera sp. RV14]
MKELNRRPGSPRLSAQTLSEAVPDRFGYSKFTCPSDGIANERMEIPGSGRRDGASVR